MNADDLRALQAPLKEKYKVDAAIAVESSVMASAVY
jgi:hypothetical protein